MSLLKVTTAAVAVAMFATAAGAGSLMAPMAEPAVEEVKDDNNSGAILLPLAALLLIGAAIGGGSSSGSTGG